MNRTTVQPSSVIEQLERMLQSEVFRGAARSSALLKFLVEETLDGRAERLKDYTLGSEVLGRGERFDPRTDPIARVEASRLRSRLELYYATEGKTDPVVVSLPKGGYVPRFEENSPAAPGATASAGAERRRRALLTLAAILASAAVAALLWPSAPATRRSAEIRFEVATPATTDPISLALSPDGEKLVFVASDGAQARLWLRPFKVTLPRALAGTEHASLPFWSADNKSLGFFADSLIKRIDIESGRVEELAGAAVPGGAAWNQQGVIVYAGTIDSALRSISSEGKILAATTELAPGQTGHRSPHFLPDDRRLATRAERCLLLERL